MLQILNKRDKNLTLGLSLEPLTMVTSSNVMAEIMFTVYAVLCVFHASPYFLLFLTWGPCPQRELKGAN